MPIPFSFLSHRLFLVCVANAALAFCCTARAEEFRNIDPIRILNERSVSVFETAAPSVVIIEAQKAPVSRQPTILPNGWEMFFPSPGQDSGNVSPNFGSGIILDAAGHILTNHHVIDGVDPKKIQVTLYDRRRLSARLVGSDPRSDLAVLKIENPTNLRPARLGDSDRARVGEFVYAIGAPMELPFSMTFGIISAKGRSNLTRFTAYEDYIQTDTAINPGNSGGPLLNLDAEVIGINTLISGLHRGIGFAIPINMAKTIADALIKDGRVIRPWLGISIIGIRENSQLGSVFPEVESGVVVQAVHPDTPASMSELRAGDVILRVDGTKVEVAGDVQKAVLRRKVGDVVRLDIWRKGKNLSLQIKTGEMPAEPPR
jgi:serine protease Do